MSASTTRQVRHKIPLPLSIVARPHEAGPILSWRADSLALVWLDSGITPCCKSLFAPPIKTFPGCRRGDRILMWGDRSPRAKLTGDSRRGFEAVLIGDCRSFYSLARNWPLRPLRLLQQYRPQAAL